MKKIGNGLSVDMVTGEQYVHFVDVFKKKAPEQIAKELGIPAENASLLLPSAVLIKHFVESTRAEVIWMPGVSLSDGMAYDYAEKEKLIKSQHDFEQDILSCAHNISQRYLGSRSHGNTVEKISLSIFDTLKKFHGLSKRERVLLQLASRLQDCGRYISAMAVGECSYSIIMNTEIIGISHMERQIVAQSVKNSYLKFIYYDELVTVKGFDRQSYLVVAKLTAILRVAAGLARSQKKAYISVKSQVKEKELIITVDTESDILLEMGLFHDKTGFFEEVFGLKPIIKRKNRGENND